MGFSHKSHDKRSDKETQSPMLKVFKDMMQREHKDSEKSNLINEKPEKTKKKLHVSRSKSDPKACDNLIGGKQSTHKTKKKMADEIGQDKDNWTFNGNEDQSMPYQSERRDSWWLWKDGEKKKSDDTCSCGTCPLKKLFNSEYTCVSCLALLFFVSISIIFVVVFKAMPSTLEASKPEEIGTLDVKRQSDTGNSKRNERNVWNSDLTNRFGSFAGLFGSGNADSSFQDTNFMEDEGKLSSELASVIYTNKINEQQSSEKLREFYKKLIQTDAQIKKLKQGFDDNVIKNIDIDNISNIPYRYKRSLKLVKPKHLKANMKSKNKVFNKSKRLKRDGLDGFLIEKKKILFQYKPVERKRQFPKCSHAPKESNSHEKHLKHPFYQNSQRLDDLLDHVMEKNAPEDISSSMNLDVLFSNKGKCNHKSTKSEEKYEQNSYVTSKHLRGNEITSTITTKIYNQNILPNNNKNNDLKIKFNPGNFPIINQYTQNITLFDQAAENDHNFGKNYVVKVEESNNKEKGFPDRSSKFMAKIHSDIPTTVNNYQEDSANQQTLFDKLNSVFNYNHYRSSFDQNTGATKSDIKNENFYNKELSNDNLLDAMLGDTTTEKKFDINLDYNEIIFSTTPNLNLVHDSDFVNKEKQKNSIPKHSNNDWNRQLMFRKLLQTNEDDDTLGYEDLKEVLADEMDVHDDTDKQVDRKKRNEKVPDVYNRNWKGPMPLYPDELNAIIRQAAIENIKIPTNNKDLSEIDKPINEASDTDYIEDYIDNNNDRLVELAQAYSDYGVLDGKKEAMNQNKDKSTPARSEMELTLDNSKYFSDLVTRSRKGTPSEGIRFEIKPGKCKSDLDLIKVIQKHFKFKKGKKCPKPTTDLPCIHPDFHPLLNPSGTSLDKTQKLGNKVLEESVSLPKRTLKSVEYVDRDDYDNKDVAIEDTNDKDIKDSLQKSFVGENRADIANTSVENDKSKYSNKSTTVGSEFFAMMADWFHTLAQLSGETNQKGTPNSSSSLKNEENKSNEIIFPSYDSDMIENIGRRSRVLLSIEDSNSSVTVIVADEKRDSHVKESDNNGTPKVTESTIIDTKESTANITETNNENKYKSNLKNKTDNFENKTMSKRSIPANSNLIFWNDIYDDEYGVKSDYFEKSMRNKHSVKNDNFLKKSKNWFKGKVKNMAGRFHSTKHDKMEILTEKSIDDFKTISTPAAKMPTKSPISKKGKRRIRNIFSNNDDPVDFAALTANMKKVIREAADAIKQTRKLKVRESKEDTMASTLMQQLVKLMSDVVDFQVEQKTCSKLPPDLQKFLEWLMSPTEYSSPQDVYSGTRSLDSGYNRYADDNAGVMPEDYLDDRTQCLGSIQAVQELMRQHDEMDEADKSKMSGVKEYLENQLDFLIKKAASLEEFNIYKYYKKRESPTKMYNMNTLRNRRNDIRRIKRRTNKFVKSFSKKHTRTTPGAVDSTEPKEKGPK